GPPVDDGRVCRQDGQPQRRGHDGRLQVLRWCQVPAVRRRSQEDDGRGELMDCSGFVVQLLNGLAGASSLFLVGAGLSLIFGVTRLVNFAHGSFYMLGIYIAYSLVQRGGAGVWFWPALLAASLLVGVLGALI